MPRAAWILFGGTFVNRFVMPFLVIYLTRRGYSATEADRIGRRNTIALSMFASAALMLGLSQARERIR